jgi:hypothetical protein
MYKVKVNDRYNFEVKEIGTAFQVNNQDVQLDVQTRITGKSAHVLYENPTPSRWLKSTEKKKPR